MDRDAGEISELAQNRLAGGGYSANACGRTPLQLVLRGCATINISAVVIRRRASLSVPDSLTVGEFVETGGVYAAGGYPSTGAALPVSRKLPEEVYCCQAGESITRDTALVRSCGLYFAPQRLHIGADVWGQYWQQRQAPAWLASLTTLKPETTR